MYVDNLVNALRDNFIDEDSEVAVDPSSLPGLIALYETALEGEGEARELCHHLSQMSGRTYQLYLGAKKDFQSLKKRMAPSVLELFKEQLHDIEELSELCQELSNCWSEEDSGQEEKRAGLVELKKVFEQVSSSNKKVLELFSNKEKRCFHCTLSTPDAPLCPRCKIHQLYPLEEGHVSLESGQLHQCFGPLRSKLDAVILGEADLLELKGSLAQAVQWGDDVRDSTCYIGETDLEESFKERLWENLELYEEGLWQLQNALKSRREEDLVFGWSKLFKGAVALGRFMDDFVVRVEEAESD